MSPGWRLDDGEALAAAHPDTFRIAPPETRAGLERGDYAKVMVIFTSDGRETIERMWTVVAENRGGEYVGFLVNTPFATPDDPGLRFGATLDFAARHVIDWNHADDDSRAFLADGSRPGDTPG